MAMHLYKAVYLNKKHMVRTPTCGGMDSEFSHYEEKEQEHIVCCDLSTAEAFESVWLAQNAWRKEDIELIRVESLGFASIWKLRG
jgi:hypothetical protein